MVDKVTDQNLGQALQARDERDKKGDRVEYEKEKRSITRTAERITFSGADRLAVRKSVRVMLGLLTGRPRKFNEYTVDDLDTALVNRQVASLEQETPDLEMMEEAEGLRDEIEARDSLQGIWADYDYSKDAVEQMSELLLKGWRTLMTADEFEVLFNLSPTPGKTKEHFQPQARVWEEMTETLDENGGVMLDRRGKPMVRRQRKTSLGEEELIGLEGIVEKGERPLGDQIDDALRLLVALSIVRAPDKFLAKKIFPGMAPGQVEQEKMKARQLIARSLINAPDEFLTDPVFAKKVGEEEWREATLQEVQTGKAKIQEFLDLFVPAADKQEELRRNSKRNQVEKEFEKIIGVLPTITLEEQNFNLNLVREWVGTQVTDPVAEKIAWQLFYVWGLATQFNFEATTATDDLIKLAHFNEVRRKGDEAADEVGPPASVGEAGEEYCPDLVTDFLHYTNEKFMGGGRSFFQIWWTEEATLGELPWSEIRKEVWKSFLYQRWRAGQVYAALMRVDWKPEEFEDARNFSKLNKPFRLACLLKGIDVETRQTMKVNFLTAALLLGVATSEVTGSENLPMPGRGEAQWLWDSKTKEAVKLAVTRSRFLREEDWKRVEASVRRRRCESIDRERGW